jgi:uncharacterized damage-inducible protein DinB
MRTLANLYTYNAWANAKVFALCRDVDQAQLDELAPGTHGTLTETLKHLTQVEAIYYALMLRDQPPTSQELRDQLSVRDVMWFADQVTLVGRQYRELLANASDAFFDEPPTKHDGLLQVLSHSAQYRAQVFSVLGQHGIDVPNLDYVLFVKSARSAGV